LAFEKLQTIAIKKTKGNVMGEKMKKALNLVTAFLALAFGTAVLAAPFTPGNIVIYRVGGGSNQTSGATLTNVGNVVWLDECLPLTPAQAAANQPLTVVQSIMLPTNFFGGYSPLIGDAQTTIDGLMTLSIDGRFLILTGYGATLGQITNAALTTFDADFQVPRVVGLVDGNGHIDTTTVQTNGLSDGEDIRSATTTDGTNLWFSGDTSGIRYTTRGSSLATQLSSSLTNIRQLNIFSNQLYFSTASGTAVRLGTAGGQPPATISGVIETNLPGFVTNTNSPYAFLLFNLGKSSSNFDTIYITDDGGVGNAPGVYKWAFIGNTNWVNVGSITTDTPGTRGLTGYAEVSGGTTNVHMWITNGGSVGGGTAIFPYIDSTGYGVDPVNNADGGDAGQYETPINESGPGAGPNGFNFRGIAMAPVGGEVFPSGPARLSVGPITDYFLSGAFTGGPYSFTKNYSVANVGASPMTWSVSATNNWIGFSTTGSTLPSGGSITVTVSFNANANSLGTGTNLTSIIFTNSTAGNNGFDTTTRPAELILSQIGVSPSSNYFASGPVGGPFTPVSKTYTLTNGSANSLSWGAGIVSNSTWLTLSSSSGTIPAGGTANVTVSINANATALSRGAFLDTIAFTNSASSDPGSAFRFVSLLIGGGFTSNNIVIYRAGDGVAALNNQPTPVFMDEYTRAGSLIQSIPVSTNNYSCSGTAVAEGLMTRSTDKQYLVFVGYGTNKTYAAPAPASLSTVVPRVIGRVDGNGNVDVSTRLTDFNSGGNPRAAVSTNGVDMWVAGSVSGVRHTTLGSTSSSDVCTNPTANMRALNIYSNQLYAGTASATIRITTVGTGLPTTDTTAVNLPGYSATEVSPYNFVLFQLQPGATAPFDTLYVADDQGNNGASPGTGLGAIYKWSLSAGNWVSNGYVNVSQVRGLAGSVSIAGTTTNVNLFAIGSGNNTGGSGTLTAYTDATGWNAPPSGNGTSSGTVVIATAAANERWDSIALAPEIPATANISVTPGDFIVTDGPSTVTTNSKNYLVSDTSNSSMIWTATWTSSWLSLSTYGGTLAAGANTNVTESFNANATTLANGTYLDTVTYSNKVNGQGTTTRNVSLTITGSVAVADGFTTWQNQYFGCTGCPQAQPGADPFGKGMSNTNQFLAGFDPTNKSAYVHITAISKVNAGTDVRVDYLGASGNSSTTPPMASRTNVLEFTAGTANGSYNSNNFTSTGVSNILSGGIGYGTQTNMVDPGGATNKPARYYRVRVLVP
jgi:BACON domain-containing protein